MYPVGSLKIIHIDLPVNQQTTLPQLRPDEGFEWLILFLHAYHDMGADTAIYWTYREGTVETILNSGLLASGIKLVFQPYGTYQGIPMIATHDIYPYCTCAVAGGKRIYLRGLVIERPENYSLLFEEMIAHYMKLRLPIQSRE